MMWRKAIGAALAGPAGLSASASAQDWPARPITMITMVVPYAAGGPVDTIGRILASRLSEILGEQMIIENVSGAGGMTGASRVAKATPDGTPSCSRAARFSPSTRPSTRSRSTMR